MDFISHMLVGKLIQTTSKTVTRIDKLIITSFAFMPDIPVFFVYLMLGYEKGRSFWIPYNSDWNGVRNAHPVWSALWEIPHSLFFVLLIIIPVVYYYRLPIFAIFSYLSHIIIDIFTHSGEWGIKPFYPLSFQVNGYTDAWAWSLPFMMISWFFLGMLIVLVNKIIKKKRKND